METRSTGSKRKRFQRRLVEAIWPTQAPGEYDHSAADARRFAKIGFLTGPTCRRCARPVSIDLGPDTTCPACIAKAPAWQQARAAVIYDEVVRPSILALKHSGRRDTLRVFANWMRLIGGDVIEACDVIIPVPLHYTRLAKRGFNQSGWLAQTLGRASGKPVIVDALKRTRRTPSQAGLSAKGRARNVAGAFAVRPRCKRCIAGRRVLLLDDVLTTGATLTACTHALRRAGVAEVDVICLARVVQEESVAI